MRKLLCIFIGVVGVFMAACSEKTETNTATNTSSNSSEEKTAVNELHAELQRAATEGNLEQVRTLIKRGADVKLLVQDKSKGDGDYYEETPLMLASQKGHLDVVKELLAAGADVNVKDKDGKTALKLAQEAGNKEIVELLKQAGAKETNTQTVNLPKQDELNNALIKASRIGDYDEVNKLLAAGANVNAQDEWGETALMQIFQEDYSIAAPGFNYEKVQDLLLKADADINITDKTGGTALMKASYVGDVESVKKLLALGANVNAKDKEGDTALVSACIGMDSTADSDEENKNQIVKLLLAAGAQQKDKALIVSIENFPQIAKTLLAAGANANARDEHGQTPLSVALSPLGTTEIIDPLLAAGAKVGPEEWIFAARRGYRDIIKKFLEAGANINATDENGNTALKLAQEDKEDDVIQILKEAGAKE